MRVLARQIWWLQVIRITIGCATIALGVLTPWFAYQNPRAWRVTLPGGVAIAVAGLLFAIYSRLEWRPRGFAVGVTRRGLILKANGLRCPKLVAVKWGQIRGARYLPPVFSFWRGRVSIDLNESLVKGQLSTERGGIVELGPYTIGLNGFWELWHPEDVADLVNSAVHDPAFRESL